MPERPWIRAGASERRHDGLPRFRRGPHPRGAVHHRAHPRDAFSELSLGAAIRRFARRAPVLAPAVGELHRAPDEDETDVSAGKRCEWLVEDGAGGDGAEITGREQMAVRAVLLAVGGDGDVTCFIEPGRLAVQLGKLGDEQAGLGRSRQPSERGLGEGQVTGPDERLKPPLRKSNARDSRPP